MKKKKQKQKEECDVCGEEAGKSERNMSGDLCCQRCFKFLCEDCAVYGYDGLPRCGNCHHEHVADCEECGGDKEKGRCEECDYSG